MAKPQTLPAIRPNEGLRAAYQRRLDRELKAMQREVADELRAIYKREVTEDASPPRVLQEAIRRLGRRWLARFDKLAQELAEYFARDAGDRVDRQLRTALRKAGFTVKFTMTRAQNEAIQAVLAENVSLIKSIPEQYLKNVEGDVMRSVAVGRDLSTLTKALEHNYGVTRRRAALIARDQNNKATAVLTRSRQKELGITKAIWLHSAGGKTPRPTHVANSGKTYDVEKGWFDPAVGEYVWPGTLIQCRCVSRSIIPGFN